MSKINKGDVVKISDGSQAVRLDSYEKRTSIGLNTNDFTVVYVDFSPMLTHDVGGRCHDIHIIDNVTDFIYLHSACMVRKVEPAPKELTVSEISAKLGYKVKVIEG